MSSNKANLFIIILAVAVVAGGVYLFAVNRGIQANRSVIAAFLDLTEPTQIAPQGATLPKIIYAPESGTIYLSYAMPAGEKGANLFVKRSTDGGQTWSEPVQISQNGHMAAIDFSPQQMAIGPNGAAYVVWYNNYTQNTPYQYGKGVVMFARSTDNGKSFTPPVSVGANVNDTLASRNFQNITVAPDGTIYVSMLNSADAKPGGPGRSIRVISSEDGGQTWAGESVVSKDACPCCRTTLAAGRNGNIYVGWRQIYSVGDATIRDTVVAYSSDGGETWSQPVKYYDNNWQIAGCPHAGPSLELDDRGRLHAVWFSGAKGQLGIYHAISTDNGQSWSEPIPVFTPSYTPVTEPEMLVDSKGNTWIAFNDYRSGDGKKEKAHGGGHHHGHGAHGGPTNVKIVQITADGEKVTFPDLDIDGKGGDFAELENRIALVWKAQGGGIYFSTFHAPPQKAR